MPNWRAIRSWGIDATGRFVPWFICGDTAVSVGWVCMPTRCSLMTGVHTPVHGCIENGFSRYEHLLMLTDLLAEAGYHNIMVGKAHMGPVPDSFHVQRVTRGEKSRDVDDIYANFVRARLFEAVATLGSALAAHRQDVLISAAKLARMRGFR